MRCLYWRLFNIVQNLKYVTYQNLSRFFIPLSNQNSFSKDELNKTIALKYGNGSISGSTWHLMNI